MGGTRREPGGTDSNEFIPVCRPFLGDEECEAVERVIRSAWISTGPEAAAFEAELGAWTHGHVAVVSSASMATILALVAQDVGPGDEVIVPAITFVATSNAVLHIGATLVFADIDPATGLLDPEDVERKCTPRTRAIISVDLYGQRCDPAQFGGRAGVKLFSDAAQSFGTPGVTARRGVTTVFSFYATKNVTAGEGGAIVTTSRKLAEKARTLAKQGVTADAFDRYHGSAGYDVTEIGFKANLPDVLAAIARVQLKREPEMREMRRKICERYREEIPAQTISWRNDTNYHLYPIFVEDRRSFRATLHAANVGTGVHFECIPGHRAYRKLGYRPEQTPQAAWFGAHQVTLPVFAGLTASQQDRVIAAARSALGTSN